MEKENRKMGYVVSPTYPHIIYGSQRKRRKSSKKMGKYVGENKAWSLLPSQQRKRDATASILYATISCWWKLNVRPGTFFYLFNIEETYAFFRGVVESYETIHCAAENFLLRHKKDGTQSSDEESWKHDKRSSDVYVVWTGKFHYETPTEGKWDCFASEKLPKWCQLKLIVCWPIFKIFFVHES